jgi:hypothetical protein
VPTVSKYGSLNLLEPSGPVQACNGIALPLPPLRQPSVNNSYIKSIHAAIAYTELHHHASVSIHLHIEVHKYTNKLALVSSIYSKIPLI